MKRILSWLLHHANRKYKNPEFYAIKNRLLKKYGEHICYDIQFIEGKKCYSCGGTGWHHYIDSWGFDNSDSCWHCDSGWYKKPVWNILARLQFDKYIFHQPFGRSYEKPDNSIPVIEGYIEHDSSKYSDFAATILFLIYERGYVKRYYKNIDGWRLYWWLPRNYLRNIIYLIKFGPKIPIYHFKRRFKKSTYFRYPPAAITDDMPF